MLSLKRDVIFGPDGADHLQRFLEQLGTLVVAHTQRRELPLEITDTDRERESAAREQVQSRARLGHHKRVSVRQHHNVRNQAQRRRRSGSETQSDKRIYGVVSPGFQPSLRWRRVIGETEPVDPGRFGGRGHFPNAGPTHQLRVVGMTVHRVGDGEVHLYIPCS